MIELTNLIPKYKSHYSTQNKQIGSSDLNLEKLYSFYLEFCTGKKIETYVAKKQLYVDIFNKKCVSSLNK